MNDNPEFNTFVKAASKMLAQANPYNPFTHDEAELEEFIRLLREIKEIDKMRFDYIGEDGRSQIFETRSGRKIRTYYDPPPIPIRDHDWHAVDDNYEPDSPIGYGPTRDAAIADLLVQYE